MFPISNVWNKPVTGLPVRADSDTLIRSIGLNAYLHPDFSSHDGGGYGIPYNVVGGGRKKKYVKFTYASESDRGPYPIPRRPKIEGGSDRHMLIVDRDNCVLYELYAARKTSTGWKAGSGAIWNLNSNALRPAGWTSADAAGLPILPGLVRYDEAFGSDPIRHAFRVTVRATNGYVFPASHRAGSTASALPMGARLRMKASVNISGYPAHLQRIFQAMKTYGLIVADNGSDMFITGSSDPRWEVPMDDIVEAFHGLRANQFEVVQLGWDPAAADTDGDTLPDDW
jgi:hypothetical protein